MAERRHRQGNDVWRTRPAWGGGIALLVALTSVGTVGQGTPTFSVDDVSVTEGQSGQTFVDVIVRLTNPNATESSIGFTTNDDTALGGLLTASFPSAGPVTLGDGPSSPYEIPIAVSGVTGLLTSLSIFLESFNHSSPDDIDILLVSPSGEAMVLQSDAGPAVNPNTVNYGLRDYGPPITTTLLGGFYNPTSRGPADVFPAPAPAGPHAEAVPEGTATLSSAFGGTNPVGTWRLYMWDDEAGGTGSVNRVVLTTGVPEPGKDYADVFGRLTFPAGVTARTVRVAVTGDTTVEPDETFFISLGVPVNGVIGDGRGDVTIRNDDGGSGGLPPTTVNDAYQAFANTQLSVPAPGVLANDMTNLGGTMSAQVVTPPSLGSLTMASDGSFAYIPRPGVGGIDSFTYRAVNAAGEGNFATVTITINAARPTAANDRYNATLFQRFVARSASNGLLSNDLSNGGGPMTVVLVDAPTRGTVRVAPDGGFVYTPTDRNGIVQDSFTYRAVNSFGESDVAKVDIIDDALEGLVRVAEMLADGVDRTVTMRFDPPSGPAPSQYALTGGTQPGETLAVLPTGSPYPIFRFTTPLTGSYFVRMHPLDGLTLGGASNEVPLHLNTTVTPSAPVHLLGAVDGSNLTLAWKNTYGGGIPTDTFLRVSGALSLTVPLGPTETFTYTPVPSGTYTFEVFNGNSGGVSAASNAVTLTFPGPCAPPQMPENFLLYVTGRILGAIWDLPANGPAPNGYLLHVTSPIFTGSVPLRTTNIRAQAVPGAYSVSLEATTDCGSSARTPAQTVVVR
jgi:hypothetical protein